VGEIQNIAEQSGTKRKKEKMPEKKKSKSYAKDLSLRMVKLQDVS
jgi:hypothetical protein